MSDNLRTLLLTGAVLLFFVLLAACSEEADRTPETPVAPTSATSEQDADTADTQSNKADARPDNLIYLFAAFAITWIVLFLYAFFMARRQQEVEREVHTLRQQLQSGKDEGGRESW